MFDLTTEDIERILFIHHLIIIALGIAFATLCAKVCVLNKRLNKSKFKNTKHCTIS